MRRVAVTGVGLCTPLGNDTESTWSALLEGRSGGQIRRMDAHETFNYLGEFGDLVTRGEVVERLANRNVAKPQLALNLNKLGVDWSREQGRNLYKRLLQ